MNKTAGVTPPQFTTSKSTVDDHMTDATGRIFNIQRYSLYDGNGIRTLVFFKGCPLRCRWCSNPESISPKKEIMLMRSLCTGCGTCVKVCEQGLHSIVPEADGFRHDINRSKQCTGCGTCVSRCAVRALSVCGEDVTLDHLMEEILKDEMFYRTSGGGVTLGGGEVTAQHEFAVELLKRCKAYGINTAIETCGHASWEVIQSFIPVVDTFLYDLKAFYSEKHRELVGQGNELILSNLRGLSDCGANIVIRMPMIKGYNDDIQMLRDTAMFLAELNHDSVKEVNILPYHKLGVAKYGEVDKVYSIDDDPSFGDDEIQSVVEVISQSGLPVKIVKY